MKQSLQGVPQLVWIAPVLANNTVCDIGRTVKAIFNVVEPQHNAGSFRHNPEPATLIAPRLKLPFGDSTLIELKNCCCSGVQ